MIIIFGRRAYGRVDACGSEYAQTTFAHLYYVPLIPISSFWVTHESGNQRTGFNIPMHGKSVAAAYLRVWAPIFAIGAISAAPLVAGVPIALALLGLSAWSWSWRSVRGELATRRSDFNRLAFGMRCEPGVMAPDVRVQVASALRERWDRTGAQRSPNDVGKFGATDPGEAVTAYGLLRMSAFEHGGADEREAAERILRGMHEPLPAEDGPYREGVRPMAAAVHAQVASAAATVEAQRAGHANVRAAATRRAAAPKLRAKRLTVAAVVATAVAIAGFAANVRALAPVATGTVAEVVSSSSDGAFATITCGDSTLVGDLEVGSRVSHRVFLCVQGDHSIGVLAEPETTELVGPITGKLTKPDYSDDTWFGEISGVPGSAKLYLEEKSLGDARAEAYLFIGVFGIAIGLGVLAVRARRRAKVVTV